MIKCILTIICLIIAAISAVVTIIETSCHQSGEKKKKKNKIMTPLNICSGWWVSTDDRFVAHYNTKEDAIAHVKYQKERMHSTKNWHVQYIKVEFKEYITFNE